MSAALRDIVIVPAKDDAGYLLRNFGFRRCYRRPTAFHGVSNLACDCLRVEIPVEAQALSSGALGAPDRNHTCPTCEGDGAGPEGGDRLFCASCAGSGELTASGAPGGGK